MTQVHYFAEDGNFGDASNIQLIETDRWEQSDFDIIMETNDNSRLEMSKRVAAWVRLGRPTDFFTKYPDGEYDYDSVHPKYWEEI
jgi:hypothetical protein